MAAVLVFLRYHTFCTGDRAGLMTLVDTTASTLEAVLPALNVYQTCDVADVYDASLQFPVPLLLLPCF